MPIRIALWEGAPQPKPLSESTLASEKLLEDMIVASPSLISDELMLIGRQVETSLGGWIDLLAIAPDGTKTKVGYRYRLGGGTFVWPFMETVDILPMEAITMNIKTPEVLTNGGVPIMAEAVAQIKIDSSDHAIRLAAEQFLGLGELAERRF